MNGIRVRPAELPSALGIDGVGYQSGVIGLPARGYGFVALYAGTAVRCLRVGSDGTIVEVPGVRGPLRDGEPEDDDRFWLLATHGLHLIDLATGTVSRTIRDGVPAYPARLTRLDDEHLIVSKTVSTAAVVVSTRLGRVTRRLRMSTIDHVVTGPPRLLCSFERGVARPVDASLRRAGPDRSLPIGHALALNGRVAVALADLVPAMPGSDITIPRSRGVVTLLDGELLELQSRRVDGLERLDGRAGDGSLLGATRDGIVLLVPDTLDEVARSGTIGSHPTVGPIGDRVALTLTARPDGAPRLSLVSW